MSVHTDSRRLNFCPYCGSFNMKVDFSIIVSCDVRGNGGLYYSNLEQKTREAIEECPDEDIRGFCTSCGNYSTVKRTRDGKRFCFFKEEEK